MIWGMLGKKTVRVHLKGAEPSIEGILVSSAGRHVKLVGARVIQAADSSYAVEGTAIIPREAIAFWQEVTTL